MHDALSPGHVVGPYRIGELIGEGASSYVYRATNGSDTVALKILKVYSRALRQNLERECRVLSRLTSPYIVGCRGLVDADGQLGIALEYVPGPSLATTMSRGRVPLPLATELGAQIIQAVVDAHAAGLVHRDIKPSNILTVGRQAKLGDFGLVSDQSTDRSPSGMSGSSGLLGTPRYMAPEQLREAPVVDRRSDLFSLGVVLYELVCGHPPFQGDKLSVFLASARGEFVRPRTRVAALSEPIDRAIVAALEPDPDQRVPDAATLLRLWNGEALTWERPVAPPYLPNVGETLDSAPAFLATPSTPPLSTPAASVTATVPPVTEGRFVPAPASALAPSATSRALVGLGVLAAVLLLGAAGWWWTSRSAPTPAPAPEQVAAVAPGRAEPAPAEPAEPAPAEPAPAEPAPAPAEPASTVEPAPAPAQPDAVASRPRPTPRPTPAKAPSPAQPPPAPTPTPAPVAPAPTLGGGSDLKSPWSSN
jgi:serine/threonine protein kinase